MTIAMTMTIIVAIIMIISFWPAFGCLRGDYLIGVFYPLAKL